MSGWPWNATMEAFLGGRHGAKILFKGNNGTNFRLNEHTQSSGHQFTLPAFRMA
jgi:hypothetical protein